MFFPSSFISVSPSQIHCRDIYQSKTSIQLVEQHYLKAHLSNNPQDQTTPPLFCYNSVYRYLQPTLLAVEMHQLSGMLFGAKLAPSFTPGTHEAADGVRFWLSWKAWFLTSVYILSSFSMIGLETSVQWQSHEFLICVAGFSFYNVHLSLSFCVVKLYLSPDSSGVSNFPLVTFMLSSFAGTRFSILTSCLNVFPGSTMVKSSNSPLSYIL